MITLADGSAPAPSRQAGDEPDEAPVAVETGGGPARVEPVDEDASVGPGNVIEPLDDDGGSTRTTRPATTSETAPTCLRRTRPAAYRLARRDGPREAAAEPPA